MNQKRVKVAIVGLGFGAEFIPIYQKHPGAQMYAVCQRNAERLQKIGDTFGVQQRYTRYEDVLADPNVDFVHINSPIPDHAWMSIAALKAGKHVLCTVPMATTVEECRADRRSGPADRLEIHDGRNGRVLPRVPVPQGTVPEGRVGEDPIPGRPRIRRTWTAGPSTGSG